MSNNADARQPETFDGFRTIENLSDQDASLFKVVMGLSGSAAGLGDLSDKQKIERIEKRLLQDTDD